MHVLVNDFRARRGRAAAVTQSTIQEDCRPLVQRQSVGELLEHPLTVSNTVQLCDHRSQSQSTVYVVCSVLVLVRTCNTTCSETETITSSNRRELLLLLLLRLQFLCRHRPCVLMKRGGCTFSRLSRSPW